MVTAYAIRTFISLRFTLVSTVSWNTSSSAMSCIFMSLGVLFYKAVSRSKFCLNVDVMVECIFCLVHLFSTLLVVYTFLCLFSFFTENLIRVEQLDSGHFCERWFTTLGFKVTSGGEPMRC